MDEYAMSLGGLEYRGCYIYANKLRKNYRLEVADYYRPDFWIVRHKPYTPDKISDGIELAKSQIDQYIKFYEMSPIERMRAAEKHVLSKK